MTIDLIDAAIARHSEAEMTFRRRVLIARVIGRDPQIEQAEVDAHHAAFVALQKEIHVRPSVASHDDDVREGWER